MSKRKLGILKPWEVDLLSRHCSRRGSSGFRNKASIDLLYFGMMRVSECICLRPEDIDFHENKLHVWSGHSKTKSKIRIVEARLENVKEWMCIRAQLGIGANSPVICTLKGRPLDSSYFRQFMPRLAEKAGITKRCHPNGLRVSRGVTMYSEGAPLPVIAFYLGVSVMRAAECLQDASGLSIACNPDGIGPA